MPSLSLPSPIPLPWLLKTHLEAFISQFLQIDGREAVDFATPVGEVALVPAKSVSWRIFKNPISLFIGGTAAVIMELAEPRVRSGIWDHSSFRKDPVHRLQRTGLATMITIYGARSKAEAMIARIARMHDGIVGTTPTGEVYCASDVELLNWVHATAGFGFARAYHRYVCPLNTIELDSLLKEGVPAAQLYGAQRVPTSQNELSAMLNSKRDRLEPSPIIFEFLSLMQRTHVFPYALRPIQHLLVKAAVETIPTWMREKLGLDKSQGLSTVQKILVQQLASAADKIMLQSSPPVQACTRLKMPPDYLYRLPAL
jgi:uncharacterized protein (DUF2236 family)